MDKKIDLYIRRTILVIYDILAVIVCSYLAIFVRYDFSFSGIPVEYERIVRDAIPWAVLVTIGIFIVLKLYSSLWTYAGMNEIVNIAVAGILAGIAEMVIVVIMNREVAVPLPRSFYLFYTVSLCLMVFISRFLYRGVRAIKKRTLHMGEDGIARVLVVGAGDAGDAIIREIKSSAHLKMKVIGAIDDDKSKVGTYIHGVKVRGTRDDILCIVKKYNVSTIYIAMPSVTPQKIKEILEICKKSGCEIKKLPGTYQLINGDVSVSKLKEVDINDLLGREPIEIDLSSIMGYVSDKVIMVTGGGGSIGSELCRQIAKYNPRQLIIVDIYENSAYDIQNELRRDYPDLNLVVLIASVRNTNRINQIFSVYRPDIVYHAAAHKHVPLMEDSPNEAVKNNVLGTWKLVEAAHKWKVKRFIMISTDKAVNPTNIMGATKRICEMIVQTYNNHSETEFVATRFGNVLGSNGSVIPLFQKQIAEGGPVTVTHPDIIRYFMTIPEAVSLVLQAGAYAKGGEIFVLDMGEPVKIDDLARNLILLSGHKPDIDIKIEYTGLRPGEKLYEEMLMKEEGLQNTPNKLIHIGKPISFDEDIFMKQLDELKEYVVQEPNDIRVKVKEMVSSYHPNIF